MALREGRTRQGRLIYCKARRKSRVQGEGGWWGWGGSGGTRVIKKFLSTGEGNKQTPIDASAAKHRKRTILLKRDRRTLPLMRDSAGAKLELLGGGRGRGKERGGWVGVWGLLWVCVNSFCLWAAKRPLRQRLTTF